MTKLASVCTDAELWWLSDLEAKIDADLAVHKEDARLPCLQVLRFVATMQS